MQTTNVIYLKLKTNVKTKPSNKRSNVINLLQVARCNETNTQAETARAGEIENRISFQHNFEQIFVKKITI